MIKLLSLIFFILLIVVGRLRGFKTFITFFLNLFLIMLYIRFMTIGINAIVLAIIVCVLATLITLFILNGSNVKTKSSFVSIMIVLSLVLLITFLIGYFSNSILLICR